MDVGSAAEWVSGLATTAAVIFAVFGLRAERQRDRAVSDRISEEQRDRDREQAKRDQEQAKRDYAEKSAQAAKVTVWHEASQRSPISGLTCIRNGSEAVVYDVYAVLVNGRNESDGSPGAHKAFGRLLRVIPPLETVKFPAREGWGGMNRTASYDLTFRDSQGVTWFRNNRGHLKECKVSVFDQYGLDQPYTYFEPGIERGDQSVPPVP